MVLKKPKDENDHTEKLQALLRQPENKTCFDCPTKSPIFANVTIQTFVCTRCSGLVREVGHRVKSISASTFTEAEVKALEAGGNAVASAIWMAQYNNKRGPAPQTDTEVRYSMRQKYYDRRWLDPARYDQHIRTIRAIHKQSRPTLQPSTSWLDDNTPLGVMHPHALKQQQYKTPAPLLPPPPQSPITRSFQQQQQQQKSPTSAFSFPPSPSSPQTVQAHPMYDDPYAVLRSLSPTTSSSASDSSPPPMSPSLLVRKDTKDTPLLLDLDPLL
ncbi:hypothetical protein BCR43DRAFT_484165 [Syncephalastrum racemosum]|uniref:Arf-GAP domain-containing protein n=1 Tax=Syncephalastrum racemosum TaxID=13706 RepID=A0A1X2HWC7_SYNRA|nr:hypothetical protein BCR43DRAFT_484165 [Syncephalastrum racemosum]